MIRWLKRRMPHNHFWSAPFNFRVEKYGGRRPPTRYALRECEICGVREWHLHPPPDMRPGIGYPLGTYEPRPYREEHEPDRRPLRPPRNGKGGMVIMGGED